MSNEFVMVPSDLAESAVDAFASIGMHDELDQLNEILAKPAQQHLGEPLALPARKKTTAGLLSDSNTYNLGWNACLDEIAKLGPLYTHPAPADPAEVDRLAILLRQTQVKHAQERDTLRTQLADAYALLREIHDGTLSGYERYSKIEAVLSASAEPSAPECKYCGDTGQIMVGRSGAASDGNAPIMEPCEDCDGPSAPVEIDHDALVAAVCVLRSQGLGNLSAAVEEARAALERKPS